MVVLELANGENLPHYSSCRQLRSESVSAFLKSLSSSDDHLLFNNGLPSWKLAKKYRYRCVKFSMKEIVK